jgi:nitric oxide reductase subunit B
MAITWLPFAINFFGLVGPNFTKRPASVWGWTAGIILFFLSLSESYLWLFDYFFSNEIRDITVQWKGFGTMIGAWNLLMFGCSIYVMEQYGTAKMSRSHMSYAFLFVGLMNVLFNWGHHIYSLPTASWIKTVSYITSMTELLILGNIIRNWRKKFRAAQINFYILPYRLLSISDIWITLNLILGVTMSIPQLNYYTHGTHITVAHAMGATIGINTMIFMAAAFYVLERYYPVLFMKRSKLLAKGIAITNFSLIIFWTSLLGSGVTRIIGKMDDLPFAVIMKRSESFFKLFAVSGGFILLGLGIVAVTGIGMIGSRKIDRL